MRLRIVTWNVFDKNKNAEKFIEHILHESEPAPDIICLQEVPPRMLDYLRGKEGYELFLAEDFHLLNGDTKEPFYLAILSRPTVISQGKFRYKKMSRPSLCARMRGVEEGKEFLYLDVANGEERVRIFNVHLDALCGPRRRLQQFRTICKRLDRRGHNVVCGDLNITDRWYISIFNFIVGWWLFGVWSLEELRIKEIDSFERRFRVAGLKSIFRNCVTYPSLYLQLDDILVPNSSKVHDKKTFDDLYGSDHRAILAEIEL